MRNVTTRKYMAESTLDLFSTSAPGIELVTRAELDRLGIVASSAVRGGVEWRGSMRDLYRANLWLRTASRVLLRVDEFHASSFAELERRAKRVPWGRFVRSRDTVHFRVTCHKSALYHTDAVAQRLGDSVCAATGCSAIQDAGEEAEGDESGAGGEQLFVVRIDDDVVTLSADSSGTLLHKRGYRQATAKAPMRETLAAAMLLASGWRENEPLLDPLCGSGTIPVEAAMLARRIAPGIKRAFRFQRWPGFDSVTWARLMADAKSGEISSCPAPIVAADRDAGAIASTVSNADRGCVADDIEAVARPLSASAPFGDRNGWIITNPPYGVRVGTDVRNLYARLGSLLRDEMAGWRMGILTASPELERQLGVPLERMFESKNGGIRVNFSLGGATR